MRSAYRGAKHQRAKLKLHAMWSAGFALRVVVLEENTYHGSSLIQELLALAVEDIARISKQKGIPLPDCIVLVGDNTVKEVKNRYCLTAMAQLVNHLRFRCLVCASAQC